MRLKIKISPPGWLPVLLFLMGYSQAQSIREAVDLALRNNPTINAQREDWQRAQFQNKSVWRSTLPKLDFDASYRHVTDVAQIEMPIPPAGKTIRLGAYDTYDSGITASYVLFSGFAQVNSVRQTEQQVKLGENQASKSEKDIAFQTAMMYRQIQNSQLEISALESAQKRIQIQMSRLQSMLRQGMVLALDTLSLSISRLSYEQKIISARASLETSKEHLANLSGASVTVAPPSTDMPVTDFSEFVSSGIEDLQMLEVQKNIAQINRSLAKANYYPRIALNAGMRYGRPGLDMVSNEWMLYGVWAAGLSWNLFSSGADRLQEQAQEITMRKVQYMQQALGNQYRTRYNNALREMEALQDQLQVIRTTLNLAEKKMKIIESQYRNGMATANDFNDANLELTDVEISYQRYLIRLALKIHEIDYISGQPISKWRL
jgi:outer membrane protein TolC